MLIVQVIAFTALVATRIWQLVSDWSYLAYDYEVNRIEFILFISLQAIILWILWGIGVPVLRHLTLETMSTVPQDSEKIRDSTLLNFEEDAELLDQKRDYRDRLDTVRQE